MNTYQSRYAIGECVIAQTLPAKVIAITFTAHAILYEVEFEAGGEHATINIGGAHTIVDAGEIKGAK